MAMNGSKYKNTTHLLSSNPEYRSFIAQKNVADNIYFDHITDVVFCSKSGQWTEYRCNAR